MGGTPVLHDAQRLARQGTRQHRTVGDHDQRFEALIAGMEMWRPMLAMEHADDDAEEDRDDGHGDGLAQSGGRGKAAAKALIRSDAATR